MGTIDGSGSRLAVNWINTIFDSNGNLNPDTSILIDATSTLTIPNDFYSNNRNSQGNANKTLDDAIQATTSLAFGNVALQDASSPGSTGVFSGMGVYASFNALTMLDFSQMPTSSTIGENCFEGCNFPVLTTINWGNNVTEIGMAAFTTTTFNALTSLSFSGVNSIDSNAFDSATFSALTSLSFSGMGTIASQAFQNVNLSALTSLDFTRMTGDLSTSAFAGANISSLRILDLSPLKSSIATDAFGPSFSQSTNLSNIQQLVIGTNGTTDSPNPVFNSTIFTNLQCVVNKSSASPDSVDLSTIVTNNTSLQGSISPGCTGNCAPVYTQSTYIVGKNRSFIIPPPSGFICGAGGVPTKATSFSLVSGGAQRLK